MERYTLIMNFKDVDSKKIQLKFDDIKTDITSEEVGAFASKILEKNAVNYKGKRLVGYIDSTLEKLTTETI